MLYPQQKITWVLPGLPFGRGKDGDYTGATAPTVTMGTLDIAVGSNIATTSTTAFVDGDVVRFFQTRGAGAGNHQFNRIISGGGTTTLTMQKPASATYIDDAGNAPNHAQIIQVKEFMNVTATGTWDNLPQLYESGGHFGGDYILVARNTMSLRRINGYGRGHNGGGGVGQNQNGYRGEGSQAEAVVSRFRLGNAGGGGVGTADAGCGGGGGNVGAGGNGSAQNGHAGGEGGEATGDEWLNTMPLAGAGGSGGGDEDGNYSGSGGRGAGNLTLLSRYIDFGNYPVYFIGANGLMGSNPNGTEGMGSGGGGAGGNVLIMAGEFHHASSIYTTGGLGEYVQRRDWLKGGDGSAGRIMLYYSQIADYGGYTGTFGLKLDGSLIEAGGGTLAHML